MAFFSNSGVSGVTEADLSGYVTLATEQTITGHKTIDGTGLSFTDGTDDPFTVEAMQFDTGSGEVQAFVIRQGETDFLAVGFEAGVGHLAIFPHFTIFRQDALVVGDFTAGDDSNAVHTMNGVTTLNSRRNVHNETSSGTESAARTGSTVTNAGATGTITRTLPPASPGRQITYIRVANQDIRVQQNTGDEISVEGVISSGGDYFELGSLGASLTLHAVDETTWVAVAKTGTITYQPV